MRGVLGFMAAVVWMATADASLAAKGFAKPSPSTHVASVEITSDKGVPDGFADGLKANILADATLYGEDGAPLDLQVEIYRVHVKNALAAMVIGDMNYTAGKVTVVDPATGRALGSAKTYVSADRPSFAVQLVSSFDPTGIIGLTLAMRGTSRPREEVLMSQNFAMEALRQTYGDAAAKAAHVAARARAAAAATAPVAPPAPAASNAAAPASNAMSAASNTARLEAESANTAPAPNAIVPPAANATAAPL